MPYASLPSLVQAGMFQIFGTWLYHIHIYYICRSVDQQGDSDSKYIFPFDPYTESDISIPGPFCCSEAEWWEMEVVDKGSGHWDHPLVLLTHLTLLF